MGDFLASHWHQFPPQYCLDARLPHGLRGGSIAFSLVIQGFYKPVAALPERLGRRRDPGRHPGRGRGPADPRRDHDHPRLDLRRLAAGPPRATTRSPSCAASGTRSTPRGTVGFLRDTLIPLFLSRSAGRSRSTSGPSTRPVVANGDAATAGRAIPPAGSWPVTPDEHDRLAALFDRPTLEVAPALLGLRLVRTGPAGSRPDRADRRGRGLSRSGRPRLPRPVRRDGPQPADVRPRPGTAYVYLVYGMYRCLNVVTGPHGAPHAILVRAVEPVKGSAQMRACPAGRRAAQPAVARSAGRCPSGSPDPGASRRPRRGWPRGPGLVGAAFEVDGGTDRDRPARSGGGAPPRRHRRPANAARLIEASPRVGIDFAGRPWTDQPWRFSLARQFERIRADGRQVDRRCSSSRPDPEPPGRSDELSAGPTPGRGARAVERAGRSSGAASTRRTRRAACWSERSSVGIGSAHDIGPWIERAARGGRLDPSNSSRSPRRSTRPAAWRRSWPRNAGPSCTSSAASLHPLPALRSSAGPELRPGRRAARFGLAPPGRPAPGRPGRL